jgi:pyruvate/2-oxoglutarate/acetoin dehydrogenase E1 component
MTPGEYRSVWEHFLAHDDPIYVSEHRRSFGLTDEMPDRVCDEARITILAISAARLNALEAVAALADDGIAADLFHVVWLKPFAPSAALLASLARTGLGLIVDSDFEICGAARSLAYELMHRAGVPVHALGIDDRVCGAAPRVENVTPCAGRIADTVRGLLERTRVVAHPARPLAAPSSSGRVCA